MITETSQLKKGDQILWWSATWVGWLQWFFTRRGTRHYDNHKRDGKKSHVSLIYEEGDPAQELNVTVTVRLADITLPPKCGVWIYRMKDVPQEVIDYAVDTLWERYRDESYAFLQWLTYPSRWLFEIMYKYKPLYYLFFGWFWHLLHGWKDPRRWGTMFPRRGVCSEVTTHNFFTWLICPIMIGRGDERFRPLLDRLNEWDANKFHATDSEIIYEEFPDIFELIFYKPLTK